MSGLSDPKARPIRLGTTCASAAAKSCGDVTHRVETSFKPPGPQGALSYS